MAVQIITAVLAIITIILTITTVTLLVVWQYKELNLCPRRRKIKWVLFTITAIIFTAFLVLVIVFD